FNPDQTGDITMRSREMREYLETAATEGAKKALHHHTSEMKCGGCYVTPDTFPGEPNEGTKERLREHADDHRFVRFWRKVSEATVFRLASGLVVGALLAAAFALVLMVKVGGLKL
ncbi:MAG: hypothetical protein OEZ32_14570, partial [Nitrospinota bacterium]|nr:hypothetical protein [Nitrospinota bacterium]